MKRWPILDGIHALLALTTVFGGFAAVVCGDDQAGDGTAVLTAGNLWRMHYTFIPPRVRAGPNRLAHDADDTGVRLQIVGTR